MSPASHRVASSWLRSHLRGGLPRRARARGLFDPQEGGDFDDDDDDDEAKDFHLFAPRKPPKPEAPKPEPAAKKPSAPKKPESEAPKDPLFVKFLGEKYQGGEARVPNPNHETREQFPEVAFSTAMKDHTFRGQVYQEFKRWKDAQKEAPKAEEKPKAEEQHGRAEIGDTIKSVSQLRVGDVIQSDREGAPRRRIVSIHDHHVMAVDTDENGDRGEKKMLPVGAITSGRHKRIEEVAGDAAARGRKEERENAEVVEEKARGEKAQPKKQERKTPAWAKDQDALLQIALKGRVVDNHRIGGTGQNINKTVKRTLEKNGKRANFLWKPKSGENPRPVRIGIAPGTYHQREAAAYNVDRLLGEGTVVPPTVSNGDGSYQAFADGAMTFGSYRGNPEEKEVLASPDFKRMHLLDLVTANEDRHANNFMFRRTPEGEVRLFAIDNGLSMADTTKKRFDGHFDVRSDWGDLYYTDTMAQAVVDATHNIDKDLHSRLKKVDHEEFVEAIVATGLREEGAILGALVRLSALQRNSRLLQQFDDKADYGDSTASIGRFFFKAAQNPHELLRDAGEGPSFEELQKLVRDALRRQ